MSSPIYHGADIIAQYCLSEAKRHNHKEDIGKNKDFEKIVYRYILGKSNKDDQAIISSNKIIQYALNLSNEIIYEAHNNKIHECDLLQKTNIPHLWTHSEDIRLLSGILLFGEKHFDEISHFMKNGRTRAQCQQRWSRTLNPTISKKVWTEDEENMLVALVNSSPNIGWTQIARRMKNRTDVQCKYHYQQMKVKQMNVRNQRDMNCFLKVKPIIQCQNSPIVDKEEEVFRYDNICAFLNHFS